MGQGRTKEEEEKKTRSIIIRKIHVDSYKFFKTLSNKLTLCRVGNGFL
jgi:hypothetical protein